MIGAHCGPEDDYGTAVEFDHTETTRVRLGETDVQVEHEGDDVSAVYFYGDDISNRISKYGWKLIMEAL